MRSMSARYAAITASGLAPGATGAAASHCSKRTPMVASCPAMAAWSRLLHSTVPGSASVKMRSRLIGSKSSLAQFPRFQFALEQELEGVQVPARLAHVVAPGVQAVAVDQVAPQRRAVHQHVGLRR